MQRVQPGCCRKSGGLALLLLFPENFMLVKRSVKLIMSINSFFGGDCLHMNTLLYIADLVADGVGARIF